MINWFEKNRGISWLITLMVASIIFHVSSLTFDGPAGGTGYMAYIYHFTAFSYLSLFLLIALTKGKLTKSLIILGVTMAIIYGITDEMHQYFVPGRASTIKDVLVNSIGILITSIAYTNYCKKR